MSSDLEMFNQHQQDTRNRTDSLFKAILILAGGSLTVSIGLFLQQDRLPLSEYSLIAIRISWWFLFAAIIFGTLTLYVIIMRDYFFGERWRKQLDGDAGINGSDTPGYTEILILLFGNLGILFFIFGILCLAFVATSTVTGS